MSFETGKKALDFLFQQSFHDSRQIIYDVIHHMYGTAVHIQYDVVAVIFILMYHKKFVSSDLRRCLLYAREYRVI